MRSEQIALDVLPPAIAAANESGEASRLRAPRARRPRRPRGRGYRARRLSPRAAICTSIH